MPTTPPRRSNTTSAPETPKSYKKRQSGHWSEGIWWCNCDPRRKAVVREVGKDSPNKGKFFWTCGTYPYCNFFLWRDDARAREIGPATSQAAPEASQPKTPTLAQRTLTSFGYPVTPRRRLSGPEAAPTGTDSDAGTSDGTSEGEMSQEARRAIMKPSQPEPARTSESSKRKQDDLDDDFFDNLDSEEERELTAIVDSKNSKRSIQDAAQSRSNAYTTPTMSRTVDMVGGRPTPSVTRTLFPGASNKRHKTVSFDEPTENRALSPAFTPTANRGHLPPSSSPGEAVYDVTQDVMDLLRGQNIDASVSKSIQDLLETSARKSRGIAMGRDSARDALKEKGEKIARLQERVAALENKEKMLNSQLTNTKADLMRMYRDI